ncbi:hypothetical protein BLA29_008974 [Euroglyphus maynei]|uniref:Uncharacterized protein n=1 Tax=Euroglyphus maynei TaxID=6958 RepID=A0A1Y3BPJ4_EURMA|nr:hypothetical protein BLA29_008974 [Euroglyphus maynei]
MTINEENQFFLRKKYIKDVLNKCNKTKRVTMKIYGRKNVQFNLIIKQEFQKMKFTCHVMR